MMLDHLLLTRFNLPTGGVEARIRASETWLTNRWALFERYCAPSVSRQSTDDFTWLIFFDPESPQWLKDAIAPYAEVGLFTPCFRVEVTPESLLEDIRVVARHTDGMLLTTNLDNDDAIAVDFLERVRAAVDFDDRRALYVPEGLVKGPDGLYQHRDAHNAFCSVATPWSRPSTSWDEWHNMLGRTMPVVLIDGAPGWLQVVHGENVSNRVRGHLASPARWRSAFPGALDDVADPGRGALLRDRFVSGPARRLRDAGRSGIRRAAIAVLGKEGLLRLKARLRP